MIKNIDIKYVLWTIGVIVWNFAFPVVPPLYDVIAAIFFKELFS